MISLEETSDGVFMLEERELEENSQYSVHVMVTNDVGIVQTAPVVISKLVAISIGKNVICWCCYSHY